MSEPALLVLALLTGALAALAAAADGALVGCDPRLAAADPRLEPVLRRADRAHRALLLLRLTLHLVTGALFAAAFALGAREGWQAALAGAVIAVGVVFLGEAAPRAAGDAAGVRALRRLAPLVLTVDALMNPIVAVGERIERGLRRVFPPSDRDAEHEATPEQFRQVVERTAEVSRETAAILEGVFSLGDTEVQGVMVPRIDIVGIEAATPWSEVLDRVRSVQHSRLPVYEETLDEIIGVLHVKDLLGSVVAGEPPAGGWRTFVRPATFVPEGKPIDAQLRDFKQSRAHMAIVVDEYGGTAGLLTIEDILEEIVGEIRDEHDREELPIESEGMDRFWVAGRVSLDDLSDALGERFDRDEVATVGGLIFTELGRIPRAGEELTLNGFRVVVERVKQRRIERVYFERLEQHAERES